MKKNKIKMLKSLRIKHGLKQKDMARLIGISVSTYNYKENGLSDFTLTEIIKILDIFDETFENIFFTDKIRNNGINSKSNKETA